jgi:hypothetical protein
MTGTLRLSRNGNEDGDDPSPTRMNGLKRQRISAVQQTPAYFRQRAALQRQVAPLDDEESKILRYSINFTENCNVMEDDVEIYEYMSPTNSITRASVLYGTVPTPLSHILLDYRNIRTTQIRQAYADSYNMQVCTYMHLVFLSHCAKKMNGK